VYNLRYHIASLVAVFLALSLGLILGGVTVQSGAVTKQRAALVAGLRDDFAKLSEENTALHSDLELQDKLAEGLVAANTSQRLAGKHVLVLTNTGQVDGLPEAEAAVEGAGGKAAVMALAMPDLGAEESKVASDLAAYFGTDQPGDLRERTAAALAQEWVAGVAGPVTTILDEAGVLDAGDVPDQGVDGVIDLAAFDGKPDEGAIALAAALQKAGMPALAAQTRISTTALAKVGSNSGISAVDTLGTLAGRYAIALLLSGAEPGYYGVGSGAVAPFPALPGAEGQ